MTLPNPLRPMLAAKLTDKQTLEDLPYPLYASPKIDGIRALVHRGRLFSRTMKEIPNAFTQQFFRGLPEGFDGELAVGPAYSPSLMQTTMSGVMAEAGEPRVTFHLFDCFTNPLFPYWRRLELLTGWASSTDSPGVDLLMQTLVHTPQELKDYETIQLRLGYEGVILRTPQSKYKFGRSTFRESYLVKLKRYTDGEAVVVGFEELLRNANELERDERGYAKRSSHQENLVPAGTLGTLLCRDMETQQPVALGSGFTAAERLAIWENRHKYVGLAVTYKHFAVTGVKDARRQPIFKCFRDLRDR